MPFDPWLLGWSSEPKVGDESQLHSSPCSLPSKDKEMPAGIWAEVLSAKPGHGLAALGAPREGQAGSEMLRAGSSR